MAAGRSSEEWQRIIEQMHAEMEQLKRVNIEASLKNIDARMTNIEVAVSTIGSAQMTQKEKMEEKQKFWKEVLESKAISNIGKLSSPSEYRIWNNKFKNAYEQVRLYARKALSWLDSVKEKDIVSELEVGPVNMTAMEAIIEHLNMERANDMKGGGVKYEGIAEHMTELNRDLWSIVRQVRRRSMDEDQFGTRRRRTMGVHQIAPMVYKDNIAGADQQSIEDHATDCPEVRPRSRWCSGKMGRAI